MAERTAPLIAVTVGDPAGIGPEIVLQAAADEAVKKEARILVIGEAAALHAAASFTSAPPLALIRKPAEIGTSWDPEKINVLDTGTLTEPLPWGVISEAGGTAAYAAIRTATELALKGTVVAVATGPIHKESLRAAKVPYIDHTSMFTGLTGASGVMTMFQTGNLRIFFLTRHIALREVPSSLSVESVLEGIRSSVEHLRTLGFRKPRLAVAALNPHGGEHGLFGTEEEDILEPAVAAAADLPAVVEGPVPADAVFHQTACGDFDAVLSLYHDQGHIAAKTLDFHGTVSFTLGLPFLRTSVDHGTAFDIAGEGKANPRGMKEAVIAAARFGDAYRRAVARKP